MVHRPKQDLVLHVPGRDFLVPVDEDLNGCEEREGYIGGGERGPGAGRCHRAGRRVGDDELRVREATTSGTTLGSRMVVCRKSRDVR